MNTPSKTTPTNHNKNHRRRILHVILFPTILFAINYTRLIHDVSSQHPSHHAPRDVRTLSADRMPSLASTSIRHDDHANKLPRYKNTWQTRFHASKSNHRTGGYLFFKHIRKAGGTTLRSYFRHVLQYHGYDGTFPKVFRGVNRTRFPPYLLEEYDSIVAKSTVRTNTKLGDGHSGGKTEYPVYYIEQEFDAMDHQCPTLDPRWQDSLRVITLRHPVERIVSEFFYSGPGRYHPMNRTRLHLNDTSYLAELSNMLQRKIPEWMGKNYSRRRETRENRYRKDEIQNRLEGIIPTIFKALAGCSSHECLEEIAYNRAERQRNDGQYARLQSHRRNATTLIDERCTLHFITDERMFDLCNKVNRSPECPYGCDAPCFYPTSAWYNEVNATHLRWAMETLREFDVILLMETMNDEDQSAWLSDVMGVPRNASFALFHGGTMRNYGVAKEGYREKTRFYRDLLERLAGEVNDLLHEENQLEIELFEYAVKLNEMRTEQWKKEVHWTDA
eukprot:CCRYP_015408-RA/>CCRYP_015408-RA protein AED:0.22 eAED:0.15 QI:0/0/0/1/0/0.5/2/0/502